MALGAQPENVLKQVLEEGAWLAAIGLAAGLAGSFAATRLITRLLFGVKPTDPLTFAAVAVITQTIRILKGLECSFTVWAFRLPQITMEGEQSRILEASESRPARSPWRYCKLFDNHLERLPIDVAGVKARLTPKGSVGSIGWRAHFPYNPGS